MSHDNEIHTSLMIELSIDDEIKSNLKQINAISQNNEDQQFRSNEATSAIVDNKHSQELKIVVVSDENKYSEGLKHKEIKKEKKRRFIDNKNEDIKSKQICSIDDLQIQVYSIPQPICELVKQIDSMCRCYLFKLFFYFIILFEDGSNKQCVDYVLIKNDKQCITQQLIRKDGYSPFLNVLPPSILLAIIALCFFYIKCWYQFNKFQIKYYLTRILFKTNYQTYALTHIESHLIILDFVFLYLIGIITKQEVTILDEILYWILIAIKLILSIIGSMMLNINKISSSLIFIYEPTLIYLIDMVVFGFFADYCSTRLWKGLIACLIFMIQNSFSIRLSIHLRQCALNSFLGKQDYYDLIKDQNSIIKNLIGDYKETDIFIYKKDLIELFKIL